MFLMLDKKITVKWFITGKQIINMFFILTLHLLYNCKAREFLYFKLYGKQCITPVAIMTSSAKNNHEHITSLCERLGWFGRGQSSFQLFEQVWSWNYEVAFHCLFYSINIYHGSLVIWLLNCQPLVPAVSAEDGQWLVRKPFVPVCKPGGHGVIWKLANDKGIFQWFYGHGRKGATVRQVGLAYLLYIKSYLKILWLNLRFTLVSLQ